jgi:flagellar hook assembly protein FlgD
LEQNYPNPFNPVTIINYQLSISNNVTIKLYDINGKEIATLVNENKESGKHSVQFDASHLSSGTYIYRLQVGNLTQSRKMILQK